ncbi:MAG: CpaD family pilus assembly protein [Rhizobiales bacterium]|nr:CpaD family pilus assembly protein [Hyphomicrobiales bacterium]
MLRIITRHASTHVGSAIVLLSAVLLSGCALDEVALEDHYAPATHYEKYPIEVRKAPVKMGIAARAGTLTPEQINAATNFAHDARNNAQSKISIRWPTGDGKSRKVAHDIAQLFADEGVPHSKIGVGSYPGPKSSPIRISYVRKVAVTRECGDWSGDLSHDPANTFHQNYGCATQHNIAAMVARPEDFERPRAISPVEAANRTAAMSIYYLPAPPLSSSGP